MSAKGRLRQLVLKTNKLPVLSFFFRQTYHLAVRWLIHRCRQFPQVQSLYARSSYARGDFTPGINDIDLVLFYDATLNEQQEFEFLCAFEAMYLAHRKNFPMLGEKMGMLKADYTEACMKYSMFGYDKESWRKLYGDGNISYHDVVDPEELAFDNVHKAFSSYEHNFLEEAYKHTAQNGSMAEVKRGAKKVVKYLHMMRTGQALNVDEKQQAILSSATTPTHLMSHVMNALDESIQQLKGLDSPSPTTKEPLQLHEKNRYEKVAQGSAPEVVARCPQCRSTIHSALTHAIEPEYVYLILNDDATANEQIACLDVAWPAFVEEGLIPIPMTQRMFVFYCQHYEPFQFLELLEKRAILMGNDPLPTLKVAQTLFFDRAIINHSIGLLDTHRLPTEIRLSKESEDDFEDILELFLTKKLYFEKNLVKRTLQQCKMTLRRQSLEDFKEITACTQDQKSSKRSWEELRNARLKLLRRLRDDLNQKLVHYPNLPEPG